MRASNFWSSNYIEYKSNDDKSKTRSVEEYLHEIRQYLKEIINTLRRFDTWKIQLKIANNFLFSTDNDEEYVMHSKGSKGFSFLYVNKYLCIHVYITCGVYVGICIYIHISIYMGVCVCVFMYIYLTLAYEINICLVTVMFYVFSGCKCLT